MEELRLGITFPKETLEKGITLRLKNILKWWFKFSESSVSEIEGNTFFYLGISCKTLYENRNIDDVMELQNLKDIAVFENLKSWLIRFKSRPSYKESKNFLEAVKNDENNILKLIIFLKNIIEGAITELKVAYQSFANEKIKEIYIVLDYLREEINCLIRELNFEWITAKGLGLFDLHIRGMAQITQNLEIVTDDKEYVKQIINNCFSPTISLNKLKENLRLLSNNLEKIKKEYETRPEIGFLWKNKKNDDNHLGKLLNNLDIRHPNSWEHITKIFKDIKNQEDYFKKLKQTRNLILYAFILIYS